jgi:S-adenosylmethionine decarboxylase
LHLHHFSPCGGVSGVAVLAESHISVHTWPEHNFAAFDIFMCGEAEPERAAAALQDALRPSRIELTEHRRGILPGDEGASGLEIATQWKNP